MLVRARTYQHPGVLPGVADGLAADPGKVVPDKIYRDGHSPEQALVL